MRLSCICLLLVAALGSALAQPVGESCGSAISIPLLPYVDNRTTCDYSDDHHVLCYDGLLSETAGAPDVAYTYIPPVNQEISINCCLVGNRKVYVLAGPAPDTIACATRGIPCPGGNPNAHGGYIECLPVEAGVSYCFIVDGRHDDCGAYEITVEECPPCEIECPAGAIAEGEPDCYHGYEDEFNRGCFSNPSSFSVISCGDTICGTSGPHAIQNGYTNDHDTYLLELTERDSVTWCAVGEYAILVEIQQVIDDCESVNSYGEILADRCSTVCTSVCLEAGTYAFQVRARGFEGVQCGKPYIAWLTCHDTPRCGCMPAAEVAIVVSNNNQSVTIYWEANQSGSYKIYSTGVPNNDGNPPGPDWTFEANVFSAGGQSSWEDPAPFSEYRNYVIVHDCAPPTIVDYPNEISEAR